MVDGDVAVQPRSPACAALPEPIVPIEPSEVPVVSDCIEPPFMPPVLPAVPLPVVPIDVEPPIVSLRLLFVLLPLVPLPVVPLPVVPLPVVPAVVPDWPV